MRTEKELGAIRVMEALSAVDGELLERSEKAGAAVSGENKKAIPKGNVGRRHIYRYAMACAACLCLIVAGTAYYGLSQMRMGSAKGGSKGTNGAECAMENMEAEGDGAAGGVSGDLKFTEPEPDWLDISRLAALSESCATEQEKGDAENDPEKQVSDETEKMQELQRTEEVESLGASTYLDSSWEPGADAVVPEGYILELAELGKEEPGGRESSLYEWSDGEHSLWLKLTRTELTADMRFEADPLVCTVRQEWAEMLPDAGDNGVVRFALLYENGMLAEYYGVLEKDEIVMLLESLVR